MGIDALTIFRYSRTNDPETKGETVLSPDWGRVEQELRTMDRFEKPILWLHQDAEVAERDILCVLGGAGVYEVQFVTKDGEWLTAVNPDGTGEEVAIWTSDEGATTTAEFTWPVERAVEMARWYFEHATAFPNVSWA